MALTRFYHSYFKPVQQYSVTEHIILSITALKQQSDLLRCIKTGTWPSTKAIIYINGVHTFIMDKEMELNEGNEFTIVEKVRVAMQRITVAYLEELKSKVMPLEETDSTNGGD